MLAGAPFGRVQRLCNGRALRRQLLRRIVQPPPVDVQIPAGRSQVRVPENLARVANRDPCLIEP